MITTWDILNTENKALLVFTIKSMKYPTKEEILADKSKIKPKIIGVVNSWKKAFLKDWKNTPNEIKFGRLQALVLAITVIGYNKIVFIEKSKTNCYDSDKITIYLDKTKPSIISTLHETAHFLFGPSELKACRWSVKVFKECFPSEFKKLKWQGHLLVK